MAASGKESLRSHRRAGAILALAVLALTAAIALATAGSSARAASYGQIGEPWGTVGTGSGQFNKPTMFGVDPVDGSVVVGDARPGEPTPAFRLQKFSSDGTFQASAEVSTTFEGKSVVFQGVVVDDEKGLIYLVETCGVAVAAGSQCKVTGGGERLAAALRVFKTAPEGGALVPAVVSRIPLPTGTGEQLRKPSSIAVDPSSHGIVVMGFSEAGHKLIERIGPSGGVAARYEDTADKLNGNGLASSLAIAPSGKVYTVSGQARSFGKTRAWELPEDLSSLNEVPGFKAQAEAENWGGLLANTSGGAPEVALSRDGQSLYWREGESEEVLVRDYSLTTKSTKALFGGGKGRCQIISTAAPIGVWGEGAAEQLLVFDPGPEKPRDQVITFGQGGTGCPTPVAKFKINGSEADGQTVQAGAPVEFNAGSSELLGGEPKRVTWNFGDGSEPTVLKCPEPNGPGTGCEGVASLKTTHEFEANGEYTVSVEIELIHPTFGNPAPASHTLKVEGGAPPPPQPISVLKAGTGTGTVTSSPTGIDCGTTCSALFETGQSVVLTASPASGSKFSGWSGGCSGTGTCTLAGGTEQSVTARFESTGPPPSEFELNVLTAGAGTVSSSPSGIACGSTCHARFASGATVTLSAAPSGSGQFLGWSGACSGTAVTCQVMIDETRSVEADFSVPGQTLVVSLAGDGAGAVKSARPGINCGVHCEGSYKTGTVVALFPEATAGSEFVSWGGACAGAGVVCELKMSGARSVSALFARKPAVVVSTPARPVAAAAAANPAPAPAKKKPPKKGADPFKKKLAKCKKLKSAAKAKCIRRARRRPHQKQPS